MQNEYALRACRASASPVFPLELGGIQKPLTLQIDSCVPMFVSVATRALRNGIRRQWPPISSQASGAASGACGAPKLVIVTGSVESSTGAEICTLSGTAERVSRKRRTVDLGETKAGSWGCVD